MARSVTRTSASESLTLPESTMESNAALTFTPRSVGSSCWMVACSAPVSMPTTTSKAVQVPLRSTITTFVVPMVLPSR